MTKRQARGRPAHPDVLTPAEWRVAELVRHGMSNPRIAERLAISLDAVKFHVANVLSKLGLASRAELRRWDGVRIDSPLAGRPAGPIAEPQLGRIGQVSRTVRDIEAARRWYGEVLGLPHLYSFGDLAFFDCGGLRLFLERGDTPANSILYFQVGDIHAVHAALTTRGVAFVSAPHLIHRHADGVEEWMAFFEDPDRQILALMARVAPT